MKKKGLGLTHIHTEQNEPMEGQKKQEMKTKQNNKTKEGLERKCIP